MTGKLFHKRLGQIDWQAVRQELNDRGGVLVREIGSPSLCAELCGLYDEDVFRSRIVMARHNFGRGEYKYFRYPLPAPVEELRRELYQMLAPLANSWSAALNSSVRYPAELADFVNCCHRNGQDRPTPLMLRYGPGDYNCLHQDLYGETAFPMQAALLLSPADSFSGGEFVLTEQRPRMQSRVEVLRPEQGDLIIFAVNERPVKGGRGYYKVRHRHGVSRLKEGSRTTLGIIFHDAAAT